MKNLKELRTLSIEELNDELLSMRKEQFNLRLRKANGSLNKTHLVKLVRRNIAQIKTLLTEKVG